MYHLYEQIRKSYFVVLKVVTRLVWLADAPTSVSGLHIAAFFKVWRRQYVPPKLWHLPTRLYGVTINKDIVWIFASTETSKLVQAACSLASLADSSSYPQENASLAWSPKVHDRDSKNPSMEPTPRYLKPVHTPTSYFFKTPFNITLPYYGQLFQVDSSR